MGDGMSIRPKVRRQNRYLLSQRHQIEQSRKDREAGKADKNQRNHDVPDEGRVAPKRRDDVSAFRHDLRLLRSGHQDEPQFTCKHRSSRITRALKSAP
jgi:hypothetical protein